MTNEQKIAVLEHRIQNMEVLFTRLTYVLETTQTELLGAVGSVEIDEWAITASEYYEDGSMALHEGYIPKQEQK